MTLTFDPVTLTLNICDAMKLSTKFNTIEQSAAELYYGDDLEHVLHVALAYADMLCHAVTFDL